MVVILLNRSLIPKIIVDSENHIIGFYLSYLFPCEDVVPLKIFLQNTVV